LGINVVPFTPEARAQVFAAYDWFRRRLVLIIVAVMLALQFLTWRAVERVADGLPRDPPRCSTYDPCVVSLDEYSIRQIRPK
jgi:hypothetical protein